MEMDELEQQNATAKAQAIGTHITYKYPDPSSD
jgi:hypothetical protein